MSKLGQRSFENLARFWCHFRHTMSRVINMYNFNANQQSFAFTQNACGRAQLCSNLKAEPRAPTFWNKLWVPRWLVVNQTKRKNGRRFNHCLATRMSISCNKKVNCGNFEHFYVCQSNFKLLVNFPIAALQEGYQTRNITFSFQRIVRNKIQSNLYNK